MSYTLIPSVLKRADELIEEVRTCAATDEPARLALLEHLLFLRRDFRRVKPVWETKTIQ